MSGIGINDSYKQMEALGKTLENNISNVALLRAILADNLKTAAPAGELGRTFAQGQRWLRLFEQPSPFYKWISAGFQSSV